MKKIFIYLAFTLSINFAWSQCPTFKIVDTLPISPLVEKKALKPDECQAKPNYPGKPRLVVSPVNPQNVYEFRVDVYSVTTIDPNNNCTQQTKILNYDTVLIDQKYIPETNDNTIGGYYIIRTELLKKLPQSRPIGFMGVLLPEGNEFGGYWVIGYDKEYSSKEDARVELRNLVKQYPEFCKSFVYYVPKGCSYKYEFK
jgi:hypothetical protein